MDKIVKKKKKINKNNNNLLFSFYPTYLNGFSFLAFFFIKIKLKFFVFSFFIKRLLLLFAHCKRDTISVRDFKEWKYKNSILLIILYFILFDDHV